MRVYLYFVGCSLVTLSLFISFAYLMTKVDPGLTELPAKAAGLIRNQQDLEQLTLPAENYVDFDDLVKETIAKSKETKLSSC